MIHIHRICVAAILLMMLASGCSTTPHRREHGEFLAREIAVDGSVRSYRVFVPAQTAGSGRPPVILFLHGAGERGRDGVRQTQAGLGPHVRSHMDDFPAIIVFPQVPEDEDWNDNAPYAFAALDAATREFDGDADRTYLTGISMGGYGTWELALLQPARFAALVPVCGGITRPDDRLNLGVPAASGSPDPFALTAQRLREKPIWIFHGARDDTVPPEQSRRMATALKSARAADARYTEFPQADHNAWDPAYATPELWTWLFAQKRR
jgi:predicted peptidase